MIIASTKIFKFPLQKYFLYSILVLGLCYDFKNIFAETYI
jgi:hypothetical protein